ncbi:DUF6984 family protein [Puniceicoccus vermicola]|uniref:DUF6984 family protein n=1 Tax=Puniceicoccus vermicola TaxID=388746 RepID=UPI003CCD4A10
MNTFPYSIPIDRELSDSERSILRKLISETQPEREKEIDSLHVFGRCGCGSCPTVMFTSGTKREKERSILADFQGGDTESGLVGITLWESNGSITELEAWSIDGTDIEFWPELETIRPLEISR